MIMVAPRTVLRQLRSYTRYLTAFPPNQRSIYFEKLISQAFASVLILPLFSSQNDDTSIRYRVTWLGSDIGPTLAPPGPDAVASAYGFHILIEPTLKTGSNQWSQEFAACIRHGQTFARQQRWDPTDVYVTLVAPMLHIDTLRSIRQHPRSQFNIVPIDIFGLIHILSTSVMAFSMRHLELRNLFNEIYECVHASTTIPAFQRTSREAIKKWQEHVLRLEKEAFIGVKSYEVMRRIGRNFIGASEILDRLQTHPYVSQYLKIIGERIQSSLIQESLSQLSLACQVGRTPDGEELFCPVPRSDFRGRQEKLIEAVEALRV